MWSDQTDQAANQDSRWSSIEKGVEISIVMPCLNEESTIAICIQKAQSALKKMGVSSAL